MTSEAQIALTGNAEYEKKRVENQTQINLVEDLRRYMRGNEYEVLPGKYWSAGCRTRSSN